MKYYHLFEKQKYELLEAILKHRMKLIAPTTVNNVKRFSNIIDTTTILKHYDQTILSAKEWLFPTCEAIFRFEKDGKTTSIEDGYNDSLASEIVLFGLHPCDAAAIKVLSRIFSWDYLDAFFLNRLEKTIVISIGCKECNEWCFCNSVGYGPEDKRGSDIQLLPMGSDYILEVLTDKGASLLNKLSVVLDECDVPNRNTTESVAHFNNTRNENISEVRETLQSQFTSDVWHDVAERCISCGICASVCPTCHCFDIIDEGIPFKGTRWKFWDSCCFAAFTQHGSGHNPRPNQASRYRQRTMHKFVYYPDRFDGIMCVGCGRCGKACPVNIDIYDVVVHVTSQIAQEVEDE